MIRVVRGRKGEEPNRFYFMVHLSLYTSDGCFLYSDFHTYDTHSVIDSTFQYNIGYDVMEMKIVH